MSRHYGRGYHRRGSSVCHTSFSIDKLFKESTNKPSAARSAGTVGKWGVTSFTTIRGTGRFGVNKNQNKDVSEDAPEEKAKQEPPKPKKFFKSRNPGNAVAEEPKPSLVAPSSTTKKEELPSRRNSSPKCSPHSDGEHKPPIVLRIFKGTSCLVADSSDSTMSPPRQSPRGDKSPGSRSGGRRRSTQDAEDIWSPKGRRRSVVNDSPTPASPRPKRARREVIKDPAIQSIISQLISDEEGDEGFESQSQALSFEPSAPAQKSVDPPPQPLDDNSDDSIPLAATEFYRQSSANKENVLETEEKVQQEANDLALLEEAQALLTETAALSEPTAPLAVATEEKAEVEAEVESEEDSDSQDIAGPSQPIVMMSSKMECGTGLKLVIKKTPEVHVETEITPKETAAKSVPIKKKSIFKSRRPDEVGNAKRLALYKHNWNSVNAEQPQPSQAAASGSSGGAAHSAFGFPETESTFSVAALTRVPAEPRPGSPAEDAAKVMCDKKDKSYYTVIRNVKKAHQIQESGEFQELNDDVEYILDTLRDNNPMGTRCLSAITLAGRCMEPAFRMHVRAHGTVAKFFRALHDATRDPSLGLCTATIMFVLSQDRLNMDMDRDSLELMLGLLESDASHMSALDDCGMSLAQLAKNRQKVKELCAEIQSKGLAKHVNLDNITVGQLAMETLLSLTSRRAGEWFKEELRELGGLDHIVRTIADCSRHLDTYISTWTDPLLDRLRKIDRCNRVLENVMSQNVQNQNYLLGYQEGLLPSTVFTLYKVCNDEIALYPCTDPADKTSTGFVLREALLSTLKVIIQLSHDFNSKLTSSVLIKNRTRIVESSLHLLLQVPNYIPEEEKFEFIFLVLNLLTNLIEDNEDNRVLLMESQAPPDPESILETREQVPAIAALVLMFYAHEKRALEEEAQTDAILDGKKEDGEDSSQSQGKCKGEEIEETIAKLLKKAGNHMEHTFICACITTALGYLILDNKQREGVVRSYLPNGRFTTFIAVLDKFVKFMKMTAWAVPSSNQSKSKATDRILNYYIQIEKNYVVEEIKEEPTDLSFTTQPLQ